MTISDWFDKNLIDTDAKAYGVYLALLYVRFCYFSPPFYYADTIEKAKESVEMEIKKKLNKVEDIKVAIKSSQEFLKGLMKYLKVKEEEKAGIPTRIRSIDRLMSLNEFDEIEMKFYEKFKDACYKYFEDKYIDDLVKDYIRSYLMLKTYSTSLTSKTKIGSIYIGSEILRDIQNELQVDLNIATKVYTAMMASGLCLFDCIIPAPFLEEKFLAYLTPPKKLPDLTNGSKIVKKLEEISERLEMLVKDLREIIKLLK